MEAGASPASVRTTKKEESDWPRQKVHTEMSTPNTREGAWKLHGDSKQEPPLLEVTQTRYLFSLIISKNVC